MCCGPIKVRWGDEGGANGDMDDRLVVLLLADFAEMNPSQPNLADRNEFDFFFLVREDVPDAKAEIAFWFPYPSTETIVGSNDSCRARRYLPYYWAFLKTPLREPDPTLPESFGWDEDELARILPSVPSSETAGKAKLLAHLDRLTHIPDEGFAIGDGGIPVEPISFAGDGAPINQHFVAKLHGELKKGDLFHIYFKLLGATTSRIDASTAQATFYYLDDSHHPLVLNHPFTKCPAAPCAVLHAALRSTVRFAGFTSDTGEKPTFARARDVSGRELISPTNYRYREMYWFNLFNAHRGYQGGNFTVSWTYAGLDASTATDGLDGAQDVRSLVNFIQERSADRRALIGTAFTGLSELGLPAAHMETLRSLAAGKTIKQIAQERRLAVKTVRNYYDSSLSLLGLKRAKLDPAGRREVITLAVELHEALARHELDPKGIDSLFES